MSITSADREWSQPCHLGVMTLFTFPSRKGKCCIASDGSLGSREAHQNPPRPDRPGARRLRELADSPAPEFFAVHGRIPNSLAVRPSPSMSELAFSAIGSSHLASKPRANHSLPSRDDLGTGGDEGMLKVSATHYERHASDVMRECHHCTENRRISRASVPRPVPRPCTGWMQAPTSCWQPHAGQRVPGPQVVPIGASLG
jgi:hypothetical protein